MQYTIDIIKTYLTNCLYWMF